MGVQIAAWCVAGAVAVVVLVTAFYSRRPIRSLLGSGVQGLCALASVNVLAAFTGVSIGFNLFSGGVCLFLGVPGVILLLLLKVIFQI
jgi:inhibitor of the pro-sigma K processing machinery